MSRRREFPFRAAAMYLFETSGRLFSEPQSIAAAGTFGAIQLQSEPRLQEAGFLIFAFISDNRLLFKTRAVVARKSRSRNCDPTRKSIVIRAPD